MATRTHYSTDKIQILTTKHRLLDSLQVTKIALSASFYFPISSNKYNKFRQCNSFLTSRFSQATPRYCIHEIATEHRTILKSDYTIILLNIPIRYETITFIERLDADILWVMTQCLRLRIEKSTNRLSWFHQGLHTTRSFPRVID
jgi:hypothetical protein